MQIRLLGSPAEAAALSELFRRIWGDDPAAMSPVGLRALAHADGYLAGAFDEGVLVGGCVGFYGRHDGRFELHSHAAGVLPEARGRHVGTALKRHQREWARARGLDRISWTFDPLVRRNAAFNLARLGARPREYVEQFYGPMSDGINAGDESDRLVVEWRLAGAPFSADVAVEPTEVDALLAQGAVVALGRDDRGRPQPGSTDGDLLLVAVPDDVEALRATDLATALAWRRAVREVLGGLVAGGVPVTGFCRAGWYVLRRRPPRGAEVSW